MRMMHAREMIKDDNLSFMVASECQRAASQLGWDAQLDLGDRVVMNNANASSMILAINVRVTMFSVPAVEIAPLGSDLEAVVARRTPADNAALCLRALSGQCDTAA